MPAPPPVPPWIETFSAEASPEEKLALVRQQDTIPWPDAFAVCWSYRHNTVPRSMCEALAARIDIMGGQYEERQVLLRLPGVPTITHGVARVHSLLRVLFGAEAQNVALWTALMTRATPEGRRRLVTAHGDYLTSVTPARGHAGLLWSAETWAMLPALYPPGSAPIDAGATEAILWAFERDAAAAPTTGAIGDLWVDALLVFARDHSPAVTLWVWGACLPGSASFDPRRLPPASLTRLLADAPAYLRAWALTTLVAVREAPALAPVAPTAAGAPPPRRPSRAARP